MHGREVLALPALGKALGRRQLGAPSAPDRPDEERCDCQQADRQGSGEKTAAALCLAAGRAQAGTNLVSMKPPPYERDHMNFVDVVIAVFALALAAIGYERGLIGSGLPLAGFVVGAAIGGRLGPRLLAGGGESPYAPADHGARRAGARRDPGGAVEGLAEGSAPGCRAGRWAAGSTGSEARHCSAP